MTEPAENRLRMSNPNFDRQVLHTVNVPSPRNFRTTTAKRYIDACSEYIHRPLSIFGLKKAGTMLDELIMKT